ncbi:hypothetical protein OAK91_04470 [Planctomycetaceae bacterium]|nr:hypothetical protein [Planctomycetaceae bacterium]
MSNEEDIAVEALAERFCIILNDWLSRETMEEVNRRNATSQYSEACSTHNFCDPNQAMADSLESLGSEFHPDLCELINNAWALASKHHFQYRRQSSNN